MSNNSPYINGRAQAYWGGNIRCRIESEFLVDKVLAANYEKMMAMGLPFAIWREAKAVIDAPLLCSCFKDTSKQPDIPCTQCYGTGYVPGYLKMGTRNYWSEATATGWTLTNTVVDTTNRPNRIMLAAGALTGSAISPNITINVVGKLAAWEYKADAFTRDAGLASSIVVDASKDNGATWFALSALEAQAPTTQLKFRATFTRSAATVKSPMYEITRVRFPTMLDTMRNELQEPIIRALSTWDVEQETKSAYGTAVQQNSQTFWTLPLYFFDNTILENTVRARLEDDVFAEVRYGGSIGERYPMTEFRYSDTFGRFTRQEFQMRRAVGNRNDALTGEIYTRVF
jgi:hypothetical protein